VSKVRTEDYLFRKVITKPVYLAVRQLMTKRFEKYVK